MNKKEGKESNPMDYLFNSRSTTRCYVKKHGWRSDDIGYENSAKGGGGARELSDFFFYLARDDCGFFFFLPEMIAASIGTGSSSSGYPTAWELVVFFFLLVPTWRSTYVRTRLAFCWNHGLLL